MANIYTMRIIYKVDADRARLDDIHAWLKENGRHPKLVQRTVSAEGTSVLVWVLTCDYGADCRIDSATATCAANLFIPGREKGKGVAAKCELRPGHSGWHRAQGRSFA